MSRAANTVSICYGHLEWRDDALCVYFAHMKRLAGPRVPAKKTEAQRNYLFLVAL
jgi:hypothetical protein